MCVCSDMIMWYSAFISFDILLILAGIILVSETMLAGCNPIANSNFNEHVREFSLKEDEINSTKARTLHKEGIGRNSNFAPIRNPIQFTKESDNALASSGHSRGFARHEYTGHHDYEEVPYYGPDYHVAEYDGVYPHHPGYGHHHPHDHHLDHHHKHYDHALAAKAVLWPIAGLALLGAAAALVTNPILLQLGVATGKRRRRETEEETIHANIDLPWAEDKLDCGVSSHKLKRNVNYTRDIPKRKHTVYKQAMSSEQNDKKYIQVATKTKPR